MVEGFRIRFGTFAPPAKGVLVVFCDDGLRLGPATRAILGKATAVVTRAAAADRFKGKLGSALDIVAPADLAVDRLVVVGLGKPKDWTPNDSVRLGGAAMGKAGSAAEVTMVAELPTGAMDAELAADLVLGARLRAYTFDRYKTKKKDDDEPKRPVTLTVAVKDPAAARRIGAEREAVADGVVLARDLVNEPPNVLFPVAFAERAAELRKLRVAVEILDDRAMKRLGMNALLGVGQGSAHESRVVVMRWNGGKATDKPIAFVGKGVCFDTGGISIKPAAGMEDMKGDMAGAACVVGLMHALAARKAKVNAIGAIGLVENMPDGAAQRPGDIVTTMSGQTVEIINTDAEGRLVLADVLHHVVTKYKPQAMIDLATLTGAIMVALGQEHAGLFANDDKLAENLVKAGQATAERVWRMPLAPEYDKLIDSKFADMKNTGGRFGGAVTAAQFLQRYVGKTPWAHLDIAGTALGSPQTDINKSWSSGWGVRLLDRLVADVYEP
ncbi:leucyl aminopeptidase [Rhodoplanes roseus]|uniref:Probable cytosol aminopeptidase n=1 Tax=Rhodoplanes roseus TaxID=29409 RepID=A0A327KUG2_9BRAD|nr:leucyl aminopeptidase [Rhodoplanes roseus]RAI41604.1 leucyl aminopeptidase [Rhodoplanes roseus]